MDENFFVGGVTIIDMTERFRIIRTKRRLLKDLKEI